MAISPKPLVVTFFRAPGGRGIYKKPLEPTQKPTNPYMGWATPPTRSIKINFSTKSQTTRAKVDYKIKARYQEYITIKQAPYIVRAYNYVLH
jgi:hypothetical protein